MYAEQVEIWEFIKEPGTAVEPVNEVAEEFNDLDSLIRDFARWHKKSIYSDYYGGDLEKYVNGQCHSYYGYCGDYCFEFRPKKIKFSQNLKDDGWTMSKKEFTERLKKALKECA